MSTYDDCKCRTDRHKPRGVFGSDATASFCECELLERERMLDMIRRRGFNGCCRRDDRY